MPHKIITVCGTIPPEQIGFTSMHEHILCDCSMMRKRVRNGYYIPDYSSVQPDDKLSLSNRSVLRHHIVLSRDNMKLDDEQMMTGEVADFKASGGNTIVEVSAPGIRSSSDDLLGMQRISEHTGVNIVVSTGLYAEYTWPGMFQAMNYSGYVGFLRHEIAHGIGETGIFPGHIKAAYEVYSAQTENYLRAAAFVSGESGLSLQVHLGPYLTAEEVRQNVIKPLWEGGCIPGRTILCHVQLLMGLLTIEELINNPGRVPFAIELHRELLDSGFVLSFTPFGFEADDEPLGVAHYSDWYILSGLVALIKEGYAGQLVIGNDIFTKLATRRGGGEGYGRLNDFIVPAMKKCGVSDQDIYKITVENPARILAV